MTDKKHNYLHNGWDIEIYQSIKQTYIQPNTVKKENGINNTEDLSRLEQSISKKSKITQRGERKKIFVQEKICYGCNFAEHQLKECTKNENILIKYKEREYK